MPFQEVSWRPIKFVVPAMQVPVYTVNSVGKKVKKVDEKGGVIYDERIIPKGRPRLGKAGHTHTPETTVAFEKWIRNKFFQAYPGSYGIMCKGKPTPVDQYFIGCQRFGEPGPCIQFRNGSDFIECTNCPYRRRNLGFSLRMYLKDDRAIDLDNVIKVVLDSLNGVCFYDDSQVIYKEANAYYNAESERLEVTIYKMDTEFYDGVLRAGYSLKKLPIREAEDFIKFMVINDILPEPKYADFMRYLERCDTRSYVEDICFDKLKEFSLCKK